MGWRRGKSGSVVCCIYNVEEVGSELQKKRKARKTHWKGAWESSGHARSFYVHSLFQRMKLTDTARSGKISSELRSENQFVAGTPLFVCIRVSGEFESEGSKD